MPHPAAQTKPRMTHPRMTRPVVQTKPRMTHPRMTHPAVQTKRAASYMSVEVVSSTSAVSKIREAEVPIVRGSCCWPPNLPVEGWDARGWVMHG